VTNRNLEAYCGLYCGACPVYSSREDDWIVKSVLEQHGLTIDELHCEGCRSGTLSPSCQVCATRDCAKSKGLDSCSGCEAFPCGRISDFGSARPHGKDVITNLTFLREHGSEAWLAQQAVKWTCSTCGRVGSWYETTCAQCGKPLSAGYDFTPA
jgi:hypothetical protein